MTMREKSYRPVGFQKKERPVNLNGERRAEEEQGTIQSPTTKIETESEEKKLLDTYPRGRAGATEKSSRM